MVTDRWPVDFRYISRRLVTEIVQQDEATRPRRRPPLTIPLLGMSITFQERDPEMSNPFDLVRRAREAVHDNTGSIDTYGPYDEDEAPLHLCQIKVLMGFEGRHNVDIAAIFTDANIGDAGRCFIALFGSVSNYSHVKPDADPSFGLHPSDASGLYTILDRATEASDPRVDREHLWDDAACGMQTRLEVAHRFFEGCRGHFPVEHLQFFARAFHRDEDLELMARTTTTSCSALPYGSRRPIRHRCRESQGYPCCGVA
jgi:hypothetical protein